MDDRVAAEVPAGPALRLIVRRTAEVELEVWGRVNEEQPQSRETERVKNRDRPLTTSSDVRGNYVQDVHHPLVAQLASVSILRLLRPRPSIHTNTSAACRPTTDDASLAHFCNILETRQPATGGSARGSFGDEESVGEEDERAVEGRDAG